MPNATVLLCFISGAWLEFKTPNLKGPQMVWTHSHSLEKSLTVLCLVLFYPRKAVTPLHRWLEFMVMQWEAVTSLSALSACFCPLLMNGHWLTFTRSFSLGQAMYPLLDIFQEGKHSLPVGPWGSLHQAVCSWTTTLFLPRSTTLPTWMNSTEWHRFPKPSEF